MPICAWRLPYAGVLEDNGGLWLSPRVDIVDRMHPEHDDVVALCEELWTQYTNAALADNDNFQVGRYPDDPNHSARPTYYEILKPLVYVGTESYQDNRYVLQEIDDHCETGKPGSQAVIVVGDQQTFDRMMHLIKFQPVDYKHIVPFNGEMHFAAHFLHGLWRLYWNKLLHWAVGALKMQATLKEEWTVKQWNYYDDFMMIFVSGCLRWLMHHVPPGYRDVTPLLNIADNNRDFLMIVHFLYDVGIPYVALRQTLRMSSTPELRKRMNAFYNLSMHVCRVPNVNKFLYAIVCVQAVWLYHNVIPCLRKVWDDMATVSLRGYRGRNVPIDHLCEKVNLASKMIVKTKPTPYRITMMVPLLNVCLPVEAEYFKQLDCESGTDGQPSEAYTGKADRQASIRAVVSILNHWVGGSWDHITRNNDDLHLVAVSAASQGDMPWDQVVASSESWREYVVEKQGLIFR